VRIHFVTHYVAVHIVVLAFKLSAVGILVFPVAAAKILNALPDNVISASSIDSFRHLWKTFLRSSNPSVVVTLVDLVVVLVTIIIISKTLIIFLFSAGFQLLDFSDTFQQTLLILIPLVRMFAVFTIFFMDG